MKYLVEYPQEPMNELMNIGEEFGKFHILTNSMTPMSYENRDKTMALSTLENLYHSKDLSVLPFALEDTIDYILPPKEAYRGEQHETLNL